MTHFINATGTLAGGSPHIDLTGMLGDGRLDPGESVTAWPAFQNLLGRPFTFVYNLLGLIL